MMSVVWMCAFCFLPPKLMLKPKNTILSVNTLFTMGRRDEEKDFCWWLVEWAYADIQRIRFFFDFTCFIPLLLSHVHLFYSISFRSNGPNIFLMTTKRMVRVFTIDQKESEWETKRNREKIVFNDSLWSSEISCFFSQSDFPVFSSSHRRRSTNLD